MRSKISTDSLPSYNKATREVREIFEMAGYFPDSSRIRMSVLQIVKPNSTFELPYFSSQNFQLDLLYTCKGNSNEQSPSGETNISLTSEEFPDILWIHKIYYCYEKCQPLLCITHTVEHNYISPSSTVGIQLHVSALYVGHLQVVI